jgi:hypothetical protein
MEMEKFYLSLGNNIDWIKIRCINQEQNFRRRPRKPHSGLKDCVDSVKYGMQQPLRIPFQ